MSNSLQSGPSISFDARPASIAWEPISLAPPAPGFAWAWFKPVAAPGGLFFRLPDPSQGIQPQTAPTLRQLLRAAGIAPADVAICYIYGVPADPRTDAAALDLPLGLAPRGGDPNIVVLVAPAIPRMPGNPASAVQAGMDHVYDEIDADWNVTLQIEKQLVLVRKQLANMLARLGTLDRDLNPEERLHGDRQAKTDWQEARRWLKDASARLARYIKEHDIGETSAAGKRLALQQNFEQVVAPRKPAENIVQLHREFEGYRKRLQILLNNMNTAYNGAATDGERRAQEVLRRINASVRNVRAKKRGRNEDFAKLKPKQLDH